MWLVGFIALIWCSGCRVLASVCRRTSRLDQVHLAEECGSLKAKLAHSEWQAKQTEVMALPDIPASELSGKAVCPEC